MGRLAWTLFLNFLRIHKLCDEMNASGGTSCWRGRTPPPSMRSMRYFILLVAVVNILRVAMTVAVMTMKVTM